MDNTQHFGFDFPSWTDIQNKTSEIVGKVTGNPVMIANTDIANATNEALKKAGINKQVTASDVVASKDPVKATQQKQEISESVTDSLADIPGKLFGSFKWIVLAVVVVILIAVFFRISGK